MKLLREFLVSQVLRRVLGTLDLPAEEREARGALVGSLGPTLQRYLTGEVELPRR